MTLCIQITIPIAGWVAPFGYPRIKACSRLPMAFRSVPRPSSPPDAKASTERPYLARDHDLPVRLNTNSSAHHAQEPSTPKLSPQHSQPPLTQATHSANVVNASEHNAAIVGCLMLAHATEPVRRMPTATRSETHQNLINPDKDHDTPATKPQTMPNNAGLATTLNVLLLRDDRQGQGFALDPPRARGPWNPFVKGSGAAGPSRSRAEPWPFFS